MKMNRFKMRAKLYVISCFRIKKNNPFIIISSSNHLYFINRIKITRFLFAAISCFIHPNPFLFISYSTLHTSNPPKLKLSDLNYAFDCINDIGEAVALFHYMLQMKPHPSVSEFNRLFNVIVKMEHYSQVIYMFKKLTILGFCVDEYTMGIVINCYAHLKEVDMGFAIVADFLKRGCKANIVSFNCLIKGFFLRGDVDKAIDLFKKVVREKWCELNEFTIPIVLHGLCNSGNVVDAVELIRIAEKRNWKVNVVGYSAVVDGLCKARMLKEGMELFFTMIDKDIIPDVVSYTCLMHGLCKSGKLDVAHSILNELLSKGKCPNVITYTVMIQGFCRNGLFQDGKQMLEKMEQAGCFPNSVTYNVIIQACLHHLDSFDAINLLKQIVGRDFQLDATSFFVLLRRIQGSHHDDVINLLIPKLMSSDAIHQTSSLKHKLKFF